jgi:hypothetical protein
MSKEKFCNDVSCAMRTFRVTTERTTCLGCGANLVTVSILGSIFGDIDPETLFKDPDVFKDLFPDG